MWYSLSVFLYRFFVSAVEKKEMNVTFTSKNKKIIQYIVNYFYTKNLTSGNLNAHLRHLQDKYARGVSLVVHEAPVVSSGKPVRSKKINICIEEKSNLKM